jgi:hypothetical protein
MPVLVFPGKQRFDRIRGAGKQGSFRPRRE